MTKQIYSRCIPFLSMLYVLTGVAPNIFGHDLFVFAHREIFISVGTLIGPLWLVLNDIIAEIYGFKLVRNLFFCAMVCEISIGVFTHWILKLPTYDSRVGQYYKFIFSSFTIKSALSYMAMLISWRINTYFLLKWKILMRSKHFWLRSMGSSVIGTIIFLSIMWPYILWFTDSYTTMTANEIFHIFLSSYLLRILLVGFYAIPATFVVTLIRTVDNIPLVQTEFNNNPFVKEK